MLSVMLLIMHQVGNGESFCVSDLFNSNRWPMMEGTVTFNNSFDSRARKLNIIMLLSFCVIAVCCIVTVPKLPVAIIFGLLSIMLFYTIIIQEITATPVLVDMDSSGISLKFKIGRPVKIKWDKMTGWRRIKAAGVDSRIHLCVGDRKGYHFDKMAFSQISNRYFEIIGKPLKELTTDDILAMYQRSKGKRGC